MDGLNYRHSGLPYLFSRLMNTQCTITQQASPTGPIDFMCPDNNIVWTGKDSSPGVSNNIGKLKLVKPYIQHFTAEVD